jgi:DNA invertase Pin-like site-specific DNA recombinase
MTTRFRDERRFAPPVRQWHSDGRSPSRQWEDHRREAEDRAALVRILYSESWPIHEIARYLGCGRAFVINNVQGGLW